MQFDTFKIAVKFQSEKAEMQMVLDQCTSL